MVKIGLNGFGRLGRILLKIAINKCKQKTATDVSRIVMLNDPNINAECLAYQLKHDSFYGISNSDIVEMGSSLMIDGQRVEISKEANPEKIPWTNNNIEYVIDTTGTGNDLSCKQASKFLTKGIQRVIVIGCSDIPMFVYGVNHCCYDLAMKTVSASRPSMTCLVPLLRVIHENFNIQEALVTSLHPVTNSDHILDDTTSYGQCREGRSAFANFAPTSSQTQRKFVNRIMPELEGKIVSAAIRLPVPIVGAVDLTVRLGKESPLDIMKCRLKEASESYLKGVLKYSDEYLVSSDIIGNSNSCVFDAKASIALSKCTLKLFAWYDSEVSFANRIYDLATYMASRESCPKK